MQTIIIAFTVVALILISVYTIIKMKELSSITKIMINLLFWATGAIVSYITKLIITSNRNKLSAQA